MFSLDTWQEILGTIQKNLLRTFLTAFSVAWGIFLLMLLLGSGTGLKNGVMYEFRDDAHNTLFINPGQTSIPYKGMAPGRRIRFTDEDFDAVKEQVPDVEFITGRYFVNGSLVVRYKKEFSSFNIRSVHPDHKYLEKTIMQKGRFINDIDIKEKRKIAIIGNKVEETLFKNGEEAVGKYIDINSTKFKVAGVFEDVGSENEQTTIYIPITTGRVVFGGNDTIHSILLTMDTEDLEQSNKIKDAAHTLLAKKHTVSKEDPRALRLFNLFEEFQRFIQLFNIIDLAMWVIGIFTIIAGVVGVSNIMLITVKERTSEIGVRKALGATPASIVGLFMQEAMAITIVAGYLGLVFGLGLVEAVNYALLQIGGVEYFRNPNVNFETAIAATILLIVAGVLAGIVPAIKAAKLQPIEALRDE